MWTLAVIFILATGGLSVAEDGWSAAFFSAIMVMAAVPQALEVYRHEESDADEE